MTIDGALPKHSWVIRNDAIHGAKIHELVAVINGPRHGLICTFHAATGRKARHRGSLALAFTVQGSVQRLDHHLWHNASPIATAAFGIAEKRRACGR